VTEIEPELIFYRPGGGCVQTPQILAVRRRQRGPTGIQDPAFPHTPDGVDGLGGPLRGEPVNGLPQPTTECIQELGGRIPGRVRPGHSFVFESQWGDPNKFLNAVQCVGPLYQTKIERI
jgi:hypothetical protein